MTRCLVRFGTSVLPAHLLHLGPVWATVDIIGEWLVVPAASVEVT